MEGWGDSRLGAGQAGGWKKTYLSSHGERERLKVVVERIGENVHFASYRMSSTVAWTYAVRKKKKKAVARVVWAIC